MKRLILLGALLLAGGFLLQDISVGHGGSYRGPGDTAPGGGGGGGGGGAGPSTPGPSGPSTGGPSGPSTPGPAGPGTGTGTGGASPKGPSTGAASSGPDLSTWDFWWGFNKDPYLNLKAAIYGGVSTGSDDFFLQKGETGGAKNKYKPSEEAIRTRIVPALKEALEKETANDIVTGCLVALAKIGDVKSEEGKSEFEPIIKKFLGDPNQEIAETAAVSLGILANEASVDTLKQLATDSAEGRKLVGTTEVKYRSRAFATYGLGLIGARTAKNEVRQEIVRVLVEILSTPETSTRDVKVAAVIAMGLVAVDIDQSGDGVEQKEPSASRQSEVKFLKKFFQDEKNHFQIRAHAPTAMARLLKNVPASLRDDAAKLFLDALDKHSKEKDEVQQSCVLALGQIGDSDKDKIDDEIRKTLTRMTEDGNLQAKNFSMIAIAQVGGRPGLGEGNDVGQKFCRDHLLNNLKGKSHLRPWAGLSIGVMERGLIDANQSANSTSKEMLRKSLEETGVPDMVGAYAIGVGICKDVESKQVLRKKLDEISDVYGKGYICIAIGLLDDHEMKGKIGDIVKESKYKPDLLKQAAIGLGLLGDKELVPLMVEMLGEAKGMSSQAALASALGFIGDSRSIDPLVSMLKSKEKFTDSARGFAAVALGIVADKEPLPWNSKISTNINYRANTPTLTGSEGTGLLDIL